MKLKRFVLSLIAVLLLVGVVGCGGGGKTKTYKIKYELDGGVLPANSVVTEYDGTKDIKLPTPTKEGSTFTAWALNSKNGTRLTNNTLPGSTKADVTVYAIWQTKQTYTIT